MTADRNGHVERHEGLAAGANGFGVSAEALGIIEAIDGERLETQLVALASIGGDPVPGIPGQRNRFATNRLALSEKDQEARDGFIIPRMQAAGAQVFEHPLGVIGTFEGKDPSLAPIVIMSHIDTVKQGDMYDGVLGVLGGIEIVQAIRDSGIQPVRNIMVLSLTGEESAAFSFALFGSKAMFHGLNDDELAATNDDGRTIEEVLGPHNTEIVRNPLFGPGGVLPTPAAVIELHVEQGQKLEAKENGAYKTDIGIVEAIAAPERYKVAIGDEPLKPDTETYAHERFMKLTVNGVSDHSGATPMDPSERADGFVETASYLQQVFNQHGSSIERMLTIGNIEADGQGMNKIPGVTSTLLRLAGKTEEEIEEVAKYLNSLIEERNGRLNDSENRFPQDPITLERIERPEDITFFRPEDILPRQKAAFGLIRAVNEAALEHAGSGVVGTVGTFETTDEGKIVLRVDIRGIDGETRADAISEIHEKARLLSSAGSRIHMGDPLPGSGEPVTLDRFLVQTAQDAINRFETAKPGLMVSAAGHDAQNAARAGIPAVMLFCRSRGGIAHNPEAYTSPEDLEMGVRSMAALVIQLAFAEQR